MPWNAPYAACGFAASHRLQVAEVLAEELRQRLGERAAPEDGPAMRTASSHRDAGQQLLAMAAHEQGHYAHDERPHVELLGLDPQGDGDVPAMAPVSGFATGVFR